MKSLFLQLQKNGSISTESIDWKAANQRLQERRDPAGLERMTEAERAVWLEQQLAQLGMESAALDADVSAIHQLSSIAASLESLGDTVLNMMEAGDVHPENIERLSQLATTISAPADDTPIALTNAEGVVSTESLSGRVKSVFVAIIAGIKRLINEVGQLLVRFRSLSGNLRRQLKNAQNGLRQYRTVGTLEFVPTVAMNALTDAEGEFDSQDALITMRRLVEQFTWCTNVLAPETTTFIVEMSKWLASLDLTSDESLLKTFEGITSVKLPQAPSAWKAVPGGQRGFKETRSELTFTNHAFTAICADGPTKDAVDTLDRAVMNGVIEYDFVDGKTVVANDDVITVHSVSDISEMITLALNLLDLQDALQDHTTKMTKELNGLMTAGQWLMDAASKAEQLDDSSVAKVVLAIQAPQSVALRVHSPFRAVLYETTRVITGVASLATKAKTALDSAE
jgi:hypothetical protein